MEKINKVIIAGRGSSTLGGILSIIDEFMGVDELNPEHSGPGYYYDLDKEREMIRKERLKESQTYKKVNQKHPAFRKGRRHG